MKYRKKPVVVEAVKWLGHNLKACEEFCDSLQTTGNHHCTGDLLIPTLEGEMTLRVGDFIIKGVQGEFYPCKPDIFAETYELVDDDAPDISQDTRTEPLSDRQSTNSDNPVQSTPQEGSGSESPTAASDAVTDIKDLDGITRKVYL